MQNITILQYNGFIMEIFIWIMAGIPNPASTGFLGLHPKPSLIVGNQSILDINWSILWDFQFFLISFLV